jgi:hypothetical protein
MTSVLVGTKFLHFLELMYMHLVDIYGLPNFKILCVCVCVYVYA